MKTLTRQQVAARKARAVQLARDVRQDDDLADSLERQSVEAYAQKRHLKLANPKKGQDDLSTATRRELLDLVAELRDENAVLQDRLQDVADLVVSDEAADQD